MLRHPKVSCEKSAYTKFKMTMGTSFLLEITVIYNITNFFSIKGSGKRQFLGREETYFIGLEKNSKEKLTFETMSTNEQITHIFRLLPNSYVLVEFGHLVVWSHDQTNGNCCERLLTTLVLSENDRRVTRDLKMF